MVLNPTKIARPTLKANLGGGYIESWHYSEKESDFTNKLDMSKERKITYKLGEITDNSILNSISKEESGAFTKLLTYAKADSNPLTTGSFNFVMVEHMTQQTLQKQQEKLIQINITMYILLLIQ